MNLAGIDVGWSRKQRSTGIALLKDDKLRLYRANVTWADRARLIPDHFKPTRIAIDGPLLPAGSHPKTERFCESFFARGAFSRRCKPGLSHFGRGWLLRKASKDAFRQFGNLFFGNRALLGDNIVEAFPNLFLGVMVSETSYQTMEGFSGSKFDWLYDQVAPNISNLMDFAPLPEAVYQRIAEEHDHELRAALICLLSAALVETGKAFRFGNSKGGWFWLPPLEIWATWAANELRRRQIGFFPCYEDLARS